MRSIGVLVVAMLGVAAMARAGGASDEALASHPEVLRGRLSNGVEYAVRRHGVPSGGLSVWLSVRVGTLSEEDGERGCARLAERVLVARASRLAEGVLEGAGVRVDRDMTSGVGFDRTHFAISVSSVDEGEAREVLKLLARMVDDIRVSGDELERQRRIVAEQERASASASLRLNTSLFPRLAPGSRIASRLPEATGASLWALKAEDVESFAREWYATSAMSVVVVGDVDAGVMVGAVTEAFGRLPVGAARATPDAGIGVSRGGAALVETDGELTGDVVELVALDHRAGALRTTGSLRAHAVEELAVRALAARLEEHTEEGELASAKMTAVSLDLSTDVRAWLSLSRGAVGTWEAQLAALALEQRRAMMFGFTPGELEAARKTLIAAARSQGEQEGSMDGAMLAAWYGDALSSGSVLMSGRQRAAALEAVFERGVSDEEVRASLVVRMDPARTAVLVLLPEAAERPSAERVTAVMRETLALPVSPRPVVARGPACMIDGVPPGGEIRELTMASAGVVTARLGSGALVHHRKVANAGGRVHIAVSLAGGLLEGDAALRGPTRAIEALWRTPAGGGRSGMEMRRLLAGKDIKFGGQVLDNRVMLLASAPKAEAETAMQLLHVLLSAPTLERGTFERWREQVSQIAEMRGVQAGPRAYEAMLAALLPPGERRTRLLSADEAATVSYEEAAARVEAVLTRSAMDAAITGDIELKPALSLASTYFATLTPRGGVAPAGTAGPECANAACVATEVRETIETPNAEQAAVMAGFRGAGSPTGDDGVALAVMAEVLTARLNADLRDRRQLTPGVGVATRANEMFPGSGQFWALAVCDPARTDEVATAIDSAITELRGWTPDEELGAARERVREQAERDLDDAGRWAEELASMGRRGRTVEEFAGFAARVGGLDAAVIRERFGVLSAPERRLRVIVSPTVR